MPKNDHAIALHHAIREKRSSLRVKLFYQNWGNNLVALREYRRVKSLWKKFMSKNDFIKMITKFGEYGELDVLSERGQFKMKL